MQKKELNRSAEQARTRRRGASLAAVSSPQYASSGTDATRCVAGSNGQPLARWKRMQRDNQAGDIFIGTVDPSVLVDSHVVIPRGTEAHLLMVEDKKGGRFHGNAEVEVELISLVIDGKKIDADSDVVKKRKERFPPKARQ